MQSVLKPIIYAVIFIAITIIAHPLYQLYSIKFVSMLSQSSQPLIIEVKRNSTATALAQQLQEKKLISSAKTLLSYIKWKGWSNQFKAGFYEILPKESVDHFLFKVVKGQVLTKTFTIIEGTTINQIKANLEHAEYLQYEPDNWKVIITEQSNPEGLLMADTYKYDAGSEASEILKLSHKNLKAFLEKSWNNRSAFLPYKSPYELLIAASILEKESSLPQERYLISGIIVNRINKNMPLQMDPTIVYAAGNAYKGKITHNHLLLASPYNTYKYKGLPPTPITTVSKSAIEAAAHPKFSEYLYFVAKGDGTHHFSKNYEEQRRAIQSYLGRGK
jgi:UPF0755 protein